MTERPLPTIGGFPSASPLSAQQIDQELRRGFGRDRDERDAPDE